MFFTFLKCLGVLDGIVWYYLTNFWDFLGINKKKKNTFVKIFGGHFINYFFFSAGRGFMDNVMKKTKIIIQKYLKNNMVGNENMLFVFYTKITIFIFNYF